MENYYLSFFRQDLKNINFQNHNHLEGDFFGYDDWVNCVDDLQNIPAERKPYFIYSLFITVLSDQCFFTYFHDHYDKINKLLHYPKFGDHRNMGPDNYNPYLLLEKPVDRKIITNQQMIVLLNEAVDLFIKEVKAFNQHYYKEFNIREFFYYLIQDPDITGRDSLLCENFMTLLKEKTYPYLMIEKNRSTNAFKNNRYFIIEDNINTNNAFLISGYSDLNEADRDFTSDTSLGPIAGWVINIGHYGCNVIDFDYYNNRVISVLIDRQFQVPEGRENTYEVTEYNKYRNILNQLIAKYD